MPTNTIEQHGIVWYRFLLPISSRQIEESISIADFFRKIDESISSKSASNNHDAGKAMNLKSTTE
jgi:hypothetical protein